MTADDRPVVLVIDDEESILRIFEMWLADDYVVRTATNGTDGLAQLDETVDVVLLDRSMPGMSGDEVLASISDREESYQVALVTAVDPDFDITEMAFDTYVTKPLDRAGVTDTVERLLGRATYDSLLQEHYAVAETLATLESEKTDAALATSAAYQELTERFADLDARLAEQSGSLDREDIVRSISNTGRFASSPAGGDTEATDADAAETPDEGDAAATDTDADADAETTETEPSNE